MSGTRGTTVTVKEHNINGALYIDGQLIGDCSLTLSVFEADEKQDWPFRHEQVFVGQSLICSEPQI